MCICVLTHASMHKHGHLPIHPPTYLSRTIFTLKPLIYIKISPVSKREQERTAGGPHVQRVGHSRQKFPIQGYRPGSRHRHWHPGAGDPSLHRRKRPAVHSGPPGNGFVFRKPPSSSWTGYPISHSPPTSGEEPGTWGEPQLSPQPAPEGRDTHSPLTSCTAHRPLRAPKALHSPLGPRTQAIPRIPQGSSMSRGHSWPARAAANRISLQGGHAALQAKSGGCQGRRGNSY